MKSIRIAKGVILGAAFLMASCTERNTPTAPSASAAATVPAGVISERSYTWSLKCSGEAGNGGSSNADWFWTAGGAPITGSGMSAGCLSGSSVSGTGTRPAAADGFSACVNNNCKTWTFDPTSSFKTQLKGTRSYPSLTCHSAPKCEATGTLTVDS